MLERYFTPYETTSVVTGQRIAILAPHPDDEIFGCGASACKWAEQGRQVQAFILTQGVVQGEFGESAEAQQDCAKQIQQRKNESIAAAAVLNLPEPIFLTGQDGALWSDTTIENDLLTQLQTYQPTCLVIPSVWEMHRDHRAAAEMGLRLASHIASLESVVCYEIGVPLKVNALEDISAYQARKWQAMQCFTSQLKTQRYADHIQGLNTYRSYTLGLEVSAAEAFHCVPLEKLPAFLTLQAEQISLVIREAEQQQQRCEQSLMQQQNENNQLRQQMTEQQARLNVLTHELDAIKNSLAWRLTKPLRWLRAKL
ncbi:PIG-L deacetylase family protein [Marinomonas gallaica]|uniref:PIG-L deacetylase family protein n=1 Tax=Marinomonas gallaica TaxID=1806667 RepID=UPI003CE5886F